MNIQVGWLSVLKKVFPTRAQAFTQSLEKLGKAIQERKALDSSNPHIARDLEVLDYKLKNLVEFSKKLGIDAEVLKTQVCPTELKKIEGVETSILSVANSELSVVTKEQVGGKNPRKSGKSGKSVAKRLLKRLVKKYQKRVQSLILKNNKNVFHYIIIV